MNAEEQHRLLLLLLLLLLLPLLLRAVVGRAHVFDRTRGHRGQACIAWGRHGGGRGQLGRHGAQPGTRRDLSRPGEEAATAMHPHINFFRDAFRDFADAFLLCPLWFGVVVRRGVTLLQRLALRFFSTQVRPAFSRSFEKLNVDFAKTGYGLSFAKTGYGSFGITGSLHAGTVRQTDELRYIHNCVLYQSKQHCVACRSANEHFYRG
jgi:hypothetical protein